jgi:hypothetical protein
MQMTKLQIFAAYTNVKAENEDLKALVSELKQKLQIDSKFPAGGYTDFYEEAEFFEENQLDAEVDVEPSKFDQRIGGPM